MKIGMLLPTCEPYTLKNIFLPSVSNLSGVTDDIVFAINYQQPYTESEIKAVNSYLQNLGFEVRYSFNEYPRPAEGHILFNKIRYDCAVMARECDVFGLCDDDFEFLNGADGMIKTVIDRFTSNDKLGIVQCKCNIPNFILNNANKCPLNFTYFTSDGFFFRNISADTGVLVFPQEALDKVGAGEEFIIGYILSMHGYETRAMGMSKIRHRRELVGGYSPHGWDRREVVLNERNGISHYIFRLYEDLKKERFNKL